MKRCLVMFSGGLDSRLAVKIMKEEGWKVFAVHFKLPFNKDVGEDVRNFCSREKVRLKIFDCTKGKLFKEYLEVVRKPKHSRGTAMNPCIDCRIFMFKKAREFADKKGSDFLVSGEVLGQRPMSQTSRAMKIVEEESGLKDRIVRPLLDLGIKGRQRKKQVGLAKKFKIAYPHPAGGCLLCEKGYCEKLKKVIDKEDLSFKDIELLKIGRHFFFKGGWIILGRDEKENKILEKEKGIKILPKQPGPTALIKGKKFEKTAKKLIQKYSKRKINDFEVKNVQAV